MADTTSIELRVDRFCELFHRNKQKYLHFALTFVRDKDAVEDIVNDSFINFWENRGNITDPTTLETYFHTIIKNNCRNWIRNKQTQMKIQQNIHQTGYRLLQYDLNSLDNYDPNLIFTEEIQAILERQLATMPELTRKIFEASRFQDMTYQEIAQKYGISVRMVTREIQSALSMLRISLKDYLPACVIGILLHLPIK